MEKAQEERLALNEALFRDVNERIREISDTFGQKDATYDFLCECSDPMCAERVVMTSGEYEYVRSDSTRFVVAKGHALPEIPSVVDGAKDHVVVEKEGAAADIAIHLDRSSSTDSGSSNNALQVSGACVDDRLRVLSVQIRREKGN